MAVDLFLTNLDERYVTFSIITVHF